MQAIDDLQAINRRILAALQRDERIAWFLRREGFAELIPPARPCAVCRSRFRIDIEALLHDGISIREVAE